MHTYTCIYINLSLSLSFCVRVCVCVLVHACFVFSFYYFHCILFQCRRSLPSFSLSVIASILEENSIYLAIAEKLLMLLLLLLLVPLFSLFVVIPAISIAFFLCSLCDKYGVFPHSIYFLKNDWRKQRTLYIWTIKKTFVIFLSFFV